MLRKYILFLDRILPSLIFFPALFQIVLEFRNELESKKSK